MQEQTVGVVGYGHVGQSMVRTFPKALVYDPYKGMGERSIIDNCDVAFICVPTPADEDTGACDTRIVFDAVRWCSAKVIVIKSSVPPGTTDEMARLTGKPLVVSPEYVGEGPTWPQAKQSQEWPFVLLGGPPSLTGLVKKLYGDQGEEDGDFYADMPMFYETEDTRSVELAKYMENVWLAMQVTFANEFYEIAEAVGASYREARSMWMMDPRVGMASHTEVYPKRRGFDGKCLPKDLSAIIHRASVAGYGAHFLRSISMVNHEMNQRSEQ